MNIYFNQMDEKCNLIKAAYGMYVYKHYKTFKEMYEDIAEILCDKSDWESWDVSRVLEKNNLSVDDFYDDNDDMVLHDGFDFDNYIEKHLSDLTDKDYAEIIEEAIKEKGYGGYWNHECFVMLREDDNQCYEITDKDFDENGKFIGTTDDGRKAIRLKPLREVFTEILEENYGIYENVDNILSAVEDMFKYMIEDVKIRVPYSENSVNGYEKTAQAVDRYEKATQEVSFLISDLDK